MFDFEGTSETDEQLAKFKDKTKEQLLNLFLNKDENRTYKARQQLFWDSEDPVKCKALLDEEYTKNIENRQNDNKVPNITLELY